MLADLPVVEVVLPAAVPAVAPPVEVVMVAVEVDAGDSGRAARFGLEDGMIAQETILSGARDAPRGMRLLRRIVVDAEDRPIDDPLRPELSAV